MKIYDELYAKIICENYIPKLYAPKLYAPKLYAPKLYVNYQIINPLKYLIINSNSISLTETNVKTLFDLLMLINQSNTFIFFSIYPIL